jgi:hypothetical protein
MHDDLVGPGFVLSPGGADHYALANAKDVEEVLPAVLPFTLADATLAELCHRCEVRDQAHSNIYL